MKPRAAIFLLSAPLLAAGAEEKLTTEQTEFFESKIRPAMVEYCYKCHSADEKIKGGLQLDNREGLRHGGDSGEAIVPGKPEESLLWTAITWADEDYEMPPKKKMPAKVIADFRKWIEMGAPDPRVAEKLVVATEIDLEAGKQFWAFQKPRKSAPPSVKNERWASTAVDRFVLAKLEEKQLAPAGEAGAEVLLRRLYFDLSGLPPSLEEIQSYAKAWRADPEAAYLAKVEELLARDQFGERWGRHWLDVARYAESTGKEVNMTFPHAWRYRDYVIDSFNEDKPYDRFVQEQIAGDLLPVKNDEEWQENLIATGFLAIGTKGLNERNPRQFAIDQADEQIDATTQSILGLTVACARCHDHKSDPIPTADYYSLSGIFQSTKTYFGTLNLIVSRRGTKLLEAPIPDAKAVKTLSPREIERLKERLADSEKQLAELQRGGRRDGGANNNLQSILRLRSSITLLRGQLNGVDSEGRSKTFLMGVQDQPQPVEARVLVRGELDKPAQEVPRGFLQVLDSDREPSNLPSDTSGRLELAQWLTSTENPLPARVMVNRVWQQLFGRGLVGTADNFGATGQTPTHPELLDYLAVEFMENGWSVKSLIRDLVTTRTYRQASAFNKAAFTADPDNELLWRFSPRRLDAEALRDALLAVSGELDLERPHGSIVAEAGDSAIGQRLSPDLLNRPVTYRSVYLPAARDALPESLALFDPSDPNIVTGTRESTNVPGQALYMMNNPFVLEQAEGLARRVVKEGKTAKERISLAFQLCYGRLATEGEVRGATEFLWRFRSEAEETLNEEQATNLAFSSFCQGLLASAEFRYLN